MTISPNPFSSAAFIEYAVREPSSVVLSIHDPLGRVVSTLVDEEGVKPGIYRATFDAEGLSSGWYSCIIRIGDRTELRKIVIQR